jgi:hypothetical protein
MSDLKPRDGGLLKGTRLTIGGNEFTAPPLNFAGLRAVQPKLGAFQVIDADGKKVWKDTAAIHDLLLEALYQSLMRNYPNVDAEWLLNTIEAAEINALLDGMTEIFYASGILTKEPASGEAESRSD